MTPPAPHLLTLDIVAGRAALLPYAPPGYVLTDEVVLVSMHKARYEHRGAPDALRHESRAWLETHGWTRHYGQPWPAPGVLP